MNVHLKSALLNSALLAPACMNWLQIASPAIIWEIRQITIFDSCLNPPLTELAMTPLKRTVRNLIIGRNQFIPSTVEFKSAMLRGLTSMLAIIVGVVWTIIDLASEVYINFYWYALLIIMSSVTFLLNRLQYYILASLVLLVMVNSITYVFASTDSFGIGTFFYFVTAGFGAMVLFGFSRRWIGYVFSALSFGLALLAYTGEYPAMPFIEFSEEYVRINFITNFIVAFIVSTLIIYFLIELHHDIESYLRQSEQNLRNTTDELKQSRERFKMAVEGSKAGIYEWDWTKNKIRFGTHFKRMLGYAGDDLNDTSFETYLGMLHPDDQYKVQKSMESHFITKDPYQNELRIRTKNGDYKWVSDSGVSIFDINNTPKLIVGSIIDIDERKKAEEQIRLQNEMLAKANQELDRFVYSASHDMRAPLSSLLGLILIAEKTQDPAEVIKCLEMMKKRVRAMEGFIREITDYSRNSRLAIELKIVNIKKLVQEVIENLKFTIGAEKIHITLTIQDELEIETDLNRLRVVLNNLIANAIKHHDPAKANQFINIIADRSNNHLSLAIEDNGQGIEEEHINHIFNMFYRASETSEGSGLGLYIVKETIDKLGGRITVKSGKGAGSVFTVELPLPTQASEH